MRAQYNSFFMLRRLVTVLVLIFGSSVPIFQCQTLMVFSTFNLIYTFSHKPMEGERQNNVEIFNETCVVICTHLVNVLLNAAVPVEFRNELGWALMGVAIFNIVSNLCITVYDSVIDIIEQQRTKARFKAYIKIVNQKLINRKYMTTLEPGRFRNYEKEITIYDAVFFVRYWHPHRKWLLANGINIKDFEEEINYH